MKQMENSLKLLNKILNINKMKRNRWKINIDY